MTKTTKTMAQIIGASIDLTKIDKGRIIEGKNGQKFYPISIIINDQKDQYNNDVSITEGQTKEERERKEKKKYIGNGRILWNKPVTSPAGFSGESFEPSTDLPF